MGVSGWMFLLVPAYPGCPGSKAAKRSLLLLLLMMIIMTPMMILVRMSVNQKMSNHNETEKLTDARRRQMKIKFSSLVMYFWHKHLQQQPFNSRSSGTTRVGRYQKKHSPAHTHPCQHTSFVTFLHLQRSTASSLFSLRAWQSSRSTSFQVLFRLPLGLEPSTSYSMHFFTQSSSFRSTCPYQRSLFCCNINAMSSTPSLSLSSLLGSLSFSLTPHIHLTILISAHWSATTFSFLTSQVSLPCNMLLQ